MRRRPKWIKARLAASLAVIALAAGLFPDAPRAQTTAAPALDTLDKLGRALFADRNLSINRTQSCVSCHSPDLAFTDPKELGKIEGAVSVGADGHSFGDRNSPSVVLCELRAGVPHRRERRADGRLFLGRPRPHA